MPTVEGHRHGWRLHVAGVCEEFALHTDWDLDALAVGIRHQVKSAEWAAGRGGGSCGDVYEEKWRGAVEGVWGE